MKKKMAISLFPPGVPWSKRLFDLVLTGIGLVLISPLLAVLALLVRSAHEQAPIFLRQVRPGYKGQPFKIFKFHSMTGNPRDAQGQFLPDEDAGDSARTVFAGHQSGRASRVI